MKFSTPATHQARVWKTKITFGFTMSLTLILRTLQSDVKSSHLKDQSSAFLKVTLDGAASGGSNAVSS